MPERIERQPLFTWVVDTSPTYTTTSSTYTTNDNTTYITDPDPTYIAVEKVSPSPDQIESELAKLEIDLSSTVIWPLIEAGLLTTPCVFYSRKKRVNFKTRLNKFFKLRTLHDGADQKFMHLSNLVVEQSITSVMDIHKNIEVIDHIKKTAVVLFFTLYKFNHFMDNVKQLVGLLHNPNCTSNCNFIIITDKLNKKELTTILQYVGFNELAFIKSSISDVTIINTKPRLIN